MFYFDLAGETVVGALCAHLRWRVRKSHERVACRLRAYAVSSIETCSTCSLVRLGFGMGVGTVACTFVSLSSLFFFCTCLIFLPTAPAEHRAKANIITKTSRQQPQPQKSVITHSPPRINVFLLLLGRLIRSYLGLSTSWCREPVYVCYVLRAVHLQSSRPRREHLPAEALRSALRHSLPPAPPPVPP